MIHLLKQSIEIARARNQMKTVTAKRDAELLRMVAAFREGILNGESSAFMCHAICLPLQSLLAHGGLDVTRVQGWVDCGDYDMEHTWLRLADGRVLDPTADQFPLSLPPVYLGQLPAAYHVNQ